MNNYFNGSGTIGFTCDNCGREMQGCTWVNGMKFCAKCYQETFGNTNPVEKELRDKIADLENKLVESESKSYTLESYNNFVNNQCKKLIKENKQLKEQLADKDREIERIKNNYIGGMQNANEATRIFKEEYYKASRDKILFAVEQLEKVKEDIKKVPITDYDFCGNFEKMYKADAIRQIDNQIKQLKGLK